MLYPMQILTATIADIAELTKVEIQSKTESLEAIDEVDTSAPIRQYRWETYFAGDSPESSKPERVVFKAMVGDKMIGYIAGHLTTRYGKDAEIQSFYLLKKHQRKGFGAQMLAHFINWLKPYHVKTLCVGVRSNNPYQQFYLKHGGIHFNEHWIGWDDVTLLEAAVQQ
jgi:GNAT superfamily N-acetyltransferase